MGTAPGTRAKNDAIEVLRGGAALLVFVYHCIQQWPEFPRGPFLVFHKGLVGVDLFLVISGYVTTASFLALRASGRPDADREYWKRRLARIFPLFWLTSVVYLLAVSDAALRGPDAWFQALTHLTLTHGFFPSTWISVNAVTWTLTLEACLYVFGWLMLRHADLDRHPVRWTLAVFAMVLGYRVFVYTCLDPPLHVPMVTQVWGTADGFWLGLLTAYAMHRGRFVPRDLSLSTRVLLAVVALGGVQALVTVMDAMGGAYWSSVWCVVLIRTGLAISFAALLVVALATTSVPLLLRPLRHAGTLSYGIYLWHLPILLLLLPWQTEPWVRAVVALFATLALSAASYWLFELPIMRWASRR